MHYALGTDLSVYPVSFDFALLTLTVFITLRNSIRERILNHSDETVSEVTQKASVKIVRKTKNVKIR